MRVLRSTGFIFCLSADPQTILDRTKGNENRPLLKVENPKEKIRELLDCRMPFYERAGIMIETCGKSPRQVAEEIAEALKWKK
jgi:shikimate kinase